MILKGKLTDKQDFFDLLDLIFSTGMSVKVKFSLRDSAVSMAFNGGSLVHLKSNFEDTRLLICNFYNKKVKVQDFVESVIVSLIYKFSPLAFESDYESFEAMFELKNVKELVENCKKKLDSIEDIDLSFKKINLGNIKDLKEVDLTILGYIVSGYTPAQAVFSMGKVDEFYESYKSLVERGILR